MHNPKTFWEKGKLEDTPTPFSSLLPSQAAREMKERFQAPKPLEPRQGQYRSINISIGLRAACGGL
jgi:hypothetical protein